MFGGKFKSLVSHFQYEKKKQNRFDQKVGIGSHINSSFLFYFCTKTKSNFSPKTIIKLKIEVFILFLIVLLPVYLFLKVTYSRIIDTKKYTQHCKTINYLKR